MKGWVWWGGWLAHDGKVNQQLDVVQGEEG